MDKWEYRVLSFQTKLRHRKAMDEWEEDLNDLGKDGWELVAAIPMHAQLGLAGSTPQVRVFLKRKK